MLDIATTDTDFMDTFGSKFGIGRLTTELKLALLAIVGAFGTCGITLVATVTTNTYCTNG